MSNSLLLRVLITLFLTGSPVFAQSLYDVVASLSDRQRVVNQREQVSVYQYNLNNDPDSAMPADNPLDWHTVGTEPTQSAVDGLGIGEKIALLNQAVQEFERLKFEFINCQNMELTTGAVIGNLVSYGESDFDPLPRATPANYNALLLALAQRVSCLRTLPWVAGYKAIRKTHVTNVGESIGYNDPNDENEDLDLEPYVVPPNNLPEGFDWKPVPLGPDGFLSVTTNEKVNFTYQINAEVRASGNYAERTEQNLVLRTAYHALDVTSIESAQLITTAQGVQGTQIDGVVSILGRSQWHELSLTGAHAHFDTSTAGLVVMGSGNTQSIPLITAPPEPAFNGSWKIASQGEDFKTENFITDGYEYLESELNGSNPDAIGAYEKSWNVGCTYTAVFKPAFSRGIDASGVKAKLEASAAALSGTSADGKFLLNPRPGLLMGIELGPGLIGMGNGYISCGNPRGPRNGTHGLERFDSSYNLQFVGNAADYHTVYDNIRSNRTQTMPGIGWPRPIINFTHDNWTLLDAWDSPRLKQIIGRDLVADVTYNEKLYGGYIVKIYRRPVNSPALVPGQAVSIQGMTLIRTWEFSSDREDEAHPIDPEHLKVTGNHGEEYVIQGEHSMTGYEWDHWQYGWWAPNFYGEILPGEQSIPYWRVMEGSWGWTLKALEKGDEGQPSTEKYRRELEITTLYAGSSGNLSEFISKDYLDNELVSTFTSMSSEPFSDQTPAGWEIVMDGKTMSGTADLGNPFGSEPAFGYGKWPVAMSINYAGIQPNAGYTWDAKGLLASQTQGLWSLTGAADGNTYTLTQKFNEATVGTNWIEFLNSGNKVKTYSAPDGNTADKADTKVAWSEIEYGTTTTGLLGLPLKLTRIDSTGTQWTWAPAADQSGTVTVESGLFSGGSLSKGTRQTSSWNTRGHTKQSETEFISSGTITVASAAVPPEQFTTWGTPKEWKDLHTGLSTLINLDGGLSRPASVTSPLGLTSVYSSYDVLGRPGQIVSNGITANNIFTGLGVSTSYSGSGVSAGSQSSFTRNATGTTTGTSTTWGGVTQSSDVVRGETTTTVTGGHSLLGSSDATLRNVDDSLESADSASLAFGGVSGDALSISNGLFVTKTAVADLPGTFAETHTDAWGRIHKIVTPSKAGGSTETNFDYSDPGNALMRIITTEPTGRVLITESDANGTINRSGTDVNGNGSLGASDRYTESTTVVNSSKVVTTLKVTEDGGMREVMKSEWSPSTGNTVTKINGNEETITSNPNHSAKTVTTTSSKGWSRTTGVNNLGLATTNTMSGTGIPTTSLTPTWRDDGTLESVSLTIGGETHTAGFNPDSTLSSLTAPGRGNILGGHSISNGIESLTVNGLTIESSLDGTSKSASGAGIIGRGETVATASGGYKKTLTPAIGASTETAFNAATTPTSKTYADASSESLGYSGELLTSIALPRGGSLALDYSNDGAKDLTSATWPAIASGAFTIPSIVHGFGYTRSGNIGALSDPSGTRTLGYNNGRLSGTTYTAGFLKGYQIIPGRDSVGRQTGTQIKRDGNTIHTTAKAPNGASNQITNLASGNITATPQRDSGGRITGYIWSDGTNSVTQTWTRGAGGRIEFAGSNVAGAPSFDYLLESPEASFDGTGRRLKAQTAGGEWTYVYSAGGQLTSAIHPTLGTFTYQYDGIGRRTDKGTANTTDILNRTTAWTHNQSKNLTIKAHPDARVWFNGVEIENFTGTHSAAITSPGTEGGWVPWETLAVLEGQGEGAGNPAPNPLADPNAKAAKSGAVWVPPAAETFTFDAAGNRQSSAQWDFGWDAKNQLARARTKNHTTAPQAYDIIFAYDSEGRRVKKHVVEYQNGAVVSEKIITFLWDGWDLLYERHQLPSGLTILERKYLWGPDIADGSAGGAGGLLLIRETKGNTTTAIIPLYDGGGNVIALTDINKNLLAEYRHGPFGEKISATGNHAQSSPWQWATKYRDDETGLYYFGHRYMDPITGQFLSRDSLGENESINLYAYCGGDPINYIDVQGLAAEDVRKHVDQAEKDLAQLTLAMAALVGSSDEEFETMAEDIEAIYGNYLGSVTAGYDELSSFMQEGWFLSFRSADEDLVTDLAALPTMFAGLQPDRAMTRQWMAAGSQISSSLSGQGRVLNNTHTALVVTEVTADVVLISTGVGAGGVAVKKVLLQQGGKQAAKLVLRGMGTAAGGLAIGFLSQEAMLKAGISPEHAKMAMKGAELFFAFKMLKVARLANAVPSRQGFGWVDKTPKGSRPHPATYMSVAERKAHAALYESGAVRIAPSAPTGTIGRTETWVFPRSVVDDLIKRSNGSVAKLERMLGLDAGYLGKSPVIIDIPSPSRVRIPTGNEFGASPLWRAGGQTSGGIPEAIIDPVRPGDYFTRPVF